MNIKEIYRLLLRHWLLLVSIPVVTAVSIYFFARNQDQKYTSETTVYTGITSGYKIKEASESPSNGPNNAFANLISLINSRDTKERVAIRLLASHLMAQARDPKALSAKTSSQLAESVPAELRKNLTGTTLEETERNVDQYFRKNNYNELYKLVNSKAPVYSVAALANVTPTRVGESDLLKIEYSTNDPNVCKQTLEIITDIFINKHRSLFTTQNQSIIGYFNAENQKAFKKLQSAEQRLFEFNRKNNIIDYEQQITTTASEKQRTSDTYNDIRAQYAGAVSALGLVERALKSRGLANIEGQEAVRQRNQLAALTKQIAELEAFNHSKADPEISRRIAKLEQERDALSGRITGTLDNYYSATHSTQGVPINTLLDDYIKNFILVEELKSKLAILTNQKNSFTGEYSKLATLGDEMRKIKRDVEVAEKEYWSQLDGLKQSQLAQQNTELASQLKVLDPPYLPGSPETSSLYRLVLLGFLGAFFFTASGVAATGVLDQSLRSPAHAAKATNLSVIGALAKHEDNGAPLPNQAHNAQDQFIRQLLIKYQQKRSADNPYVLGVLSSLSNEGKSQVASVIVASLNRLGVKALLLLPDSHARNHASAESTSFYSPITGVAPGTTITDLAGTRVLNYDVVVVEFPAVLEYTYPVSLLKHLNLLLVAVKADRKWLEADNNIYNNIKSVAKAPLEVVLTNVSLEYLEEYVGTNAKALTSENQDASAAPEQVEGWKKKAVLNS